MTTKEGGCDNPPSAQPERQRRTGMTSGAVRDNHKPLFFFVIPAKARIQTGRASGTGGLDSQSSWE